MKKILLLSAALLMTAPNAASAATSITATLAPAVYNGPTPTYDFEGPVPIVGGTIRTDNVSPTAIRPTGSTGNYYAVGGPNGSPAVLSLASFLNIGSISFLWSTPDSYNTLDVLDGSNNVIVSYTGSAVQALTGSLTSGAFVTLGFDGATVTQVKGLRFSSSLSAFEFDNIRVAAVPEPGVWALMLMGFAAIGFSLRRRDSSKVRVRFA